MVAGAVMLFSISYMSREKFFLRFHLILLSFVGSIMLLILRPNLISLLLGWDGLGVTSFLLVIYFQSAKSFNAGIITVLRNRVGDVLILLAIASALEVGDWDVFLRAKEGASLASLPTILLLVVLARFTKRAQIPFSAWLPAAMAAPTPVSSLVHSSTLVTAGVYILIRLEALLLVSGWSLVVLAAGVMTILIAGVSAIFESDMKKVVALSTLRQLGLMITSLGVGAWAIAFSHLLAHAYFKALLFMAVGTSIHMADDFQDLRKASLGFNSSITLVFTRIANLRLCGFPFLAGFYSKDWILEFRGSYVWLVALNGFLFLATVLTAAYSLRLMLLCWASTKRVAPFSWEKDYDSPTALSYLALAPLAIGGGRFLLSHLQSVPQPILGNTAQILPLIAVAVGFICSWVIFCALPRMMAQNGAWSWGLIWGLPLLSAPTPVHVSLGAGKVLRLIDLSWVALTPESSFTGGHKWISVEFIQSKWALFTGLSLASVALITIFFIYLVELSPWKTKS